SRRPETPGAGCAPVWAAALRPGTTDGSEPPETRRPAAAARPAPPPVRPPIPAPRRRMRRWRNALGPSCQLPENKHRVVAAEPEGVGHGHVDFRGALFVGHVVQVAAR